MKLKEKNRDLLVYFCIAIFGTFLFGEALGNLFTMLIQLILSSNPILRGIMSWQDNMYNSLESALENYYSSGGSYSAYTVGISGWSIVQLLASIGVAAYIIYYGWYVFEDLNFVCESKGDKGNTSNYLIVYLLSGITFGIYEIYWFYVQGNRVQRVGEELGVGVQQSGKTYLWLKISPMVCGFVGFISIIIGAVAGSIGMIAFSIKLLLIAAISGAVIKWLSWILFYNNVNKLTVAYSFGAAAVKPPFRGIEPVAVPPAYNPYPVTPVQRESSTQKNPIRQGSVTSLNGEYAGASFAIKDGEEVLVGRDSQICNLVYNNDHVSRKHCGIRFSGRENCYYVTDYSTNGVSIKGGSALPKGQATRCGRGSVLCLGKSGLEFRLQ